MRPEKRLENIFKEVIAFNPGMYNTYFKDKVGINTTQMFKTHYRQFKPSLDQIKSNSQTLKSCVSRTLRDNEVREKLRNFLVKDQINLFQRPYTEESRQAFFRHIEPTYPNLQRLIAYKTTLSKLGQPTHNLSAAADYYQYHPQEVKSIFTENRFKTLQNHPDTELATDLFSQHLAAIPTPELEILTFYSATFESFTLVTLEPYMIFILGNTLFFKLFIPLHREGATSYFVSKTVQKQIDLRNTYSAIIDRLRDDIIVNTAFLHPILRDYALRGGGYALVVSAVGSVFNYYFSKPTTEITPVESTTARTAVEKLLSGQGLESESVDKLREGAGAIAYEVGAGIGHVSQRFLQGIASRHEEIVRATATQVDAALTERQKDRKNPDKPFFKYDAKTR